MMRWFVDGDGDADVGVGVDADVGVGVDADADGDGDGGNNSVGMSGMACDALVSSTTQVHSTWAQRHRSALGYAGR